MTCPSQSIHFLFVIVISSRCFCPLSSIVVSPISYIALIIIQMMINPCLCDFPLRPFPSWKWPINPNNPPCFYTYSHFIPQSQSLQLVTVPLWVKWNWFLDPKISPVNCNFASLMWISHDMSVLKLNLYSNQCI